MYTVSKIEKEILDAMIEMSENYIVKGTMAEIVRATGRKVVGGIHTHALHNLESMGIIRKINRCKWVVLEYDVTQNQKGSRVIFEDTDKVFLAELRRNLKKLVNIDSEQIIKSEINKLIENIELRNKIIG